MLTCVEAPLVTVIIPVKNRELWLPQTLDSIVTNRYPRLEILVCDGASTDRTVEIAETYAAVRVIRDESPSNAAGWNVGLREAKGELIAFVDSDDLWPHYKLARQVELLQRRPEVDYAIGYVRHFLSCGSDVPQGFKSELLDRDVVGRLPGTLLARRRCFERIGDYDTSMKIAMDVDWFARAKDAGLKMAVMDEVMLLKRVHGTNLSNDAQVNSDELLHLLKDSMDRMRTRRSSE